MTDAAASPTRILYISPLKALGVDVERNLRSPLVGIGQSARRLGIALPEVTVGVRSGDTTSSDRRKLVTAPPDILITTPESLYLMLTSQAGETLKNVHTVIVDEVHAVAATKRGAHLAVSLERLDAILEKPAQRIGLSATVRPIDEVARFLGGVGAGRDRRAAGDEGVRHARDRAGRRHAESAAAAPQRTAGRRAGRSPPRTRTGSPTRRPAAAPARGAPSRRR